MIAGWCDSQPSNGCVRNLVGTLEISQFRGLNIQLQGPKRVDHASPPTRVNDSI